MTGQLDEAELGRLKALWHCAGKARSAQGGVDAIVYAHATRGRFDQITAEAAAALERELLDVLGAEQAATFMRAYPRIEPKAARGNGAAEAEPEPPTAGDSTSTDAPDPAADAARGDRQMTEDRDFVTVLRVKGGGRANKQVARRKDGSIEKSGVVETGRYDAVVVHVPNAAAFAALLNQKIGEDPSATMMLGYFPDQPVGVPFEIWSRKRLLRHKGLNSDALSPAERERQTTGRHEINGVAVYTRTRGNTRLSSWTLLDRDIVRDMPDELIELVLDDWLLELAAVFPTFNRAAVVVVPSTSGRVLIDGKPWSAKASWHAYIQVDDPDDFRTRVWHAALIKSFSVNAFASTCPLGFMRHGYSRADPNVRVTKIGTPWSIWDSTTCHSERLVYDGKPVVLDLMKGNGLTVAPANARVHREGERLVSSAFVDLSEPQMRKGAAHRTLHSKKPGRHGERITVAGLTLDQVVETEAGDMSIRAIWLAAEDHVRIQSPYRDSSSWAAFVGFHGQSGAPFLYDMGSSIKYVLTEEDRRGPPAQEFMDAITAWVAGLNGASGTPELVAQAARRARNAVCAAARHELPPSAVDALVGQLAELLAPIYDTTKAKLASALKKDTTNAAKLAALWAGRTDEDEIQQALADALRGYTDEGLADSVGREWQGVARHVALWGRWLFWAGATWQRDEVLLHMTRIRRHLRGLSDKCSSPEICVRLESKDTVADVCHLVRSNAELVGSVDQWDAHRMLIATPGGTVDLHTGVMRAADPRDYLTKATAVTPAPQGTMAPLWMKFLSRVTAGDRDLQDYLQRAAGYWLTGDVSEHILFFLYGKGRNGKSTFVETIMKLVGPHACSIVTETLMMCDYERHPTDIAELHGIRLAVGSEVEEGQFWAEAKIKKMTGGDRLKGRFMRMDFFEFDPQLKLVVFGNHKPSLRNIDIAIKARLHLVPFTVVIPETERDQHLKEKLALEAPAILRWAIDGCLMWQRDGLSPPACVKAATEEYLTDEDHLGQWLAERTERKASERTLQASLFHDWRSWCSDRNAAMGSSQKFGKGLEERGYVRMKGERGKVFENIVLRPYMTVLAGGKE